MLTKTKREVCRRKANSPRLISFRQKIHREMRTTDRTDRSPGSHRPLAFHCPHTHTKPPLLRTRRPALLITLSLKCLARLPTKIRQVRKVTAQLVSWRSDKMR